MSQEWFNAQYPKQGEVPLSYSHLGENPGDEIPLSLIIFLVRSRWKILVSALTFFILAGVAFALSRPNIYEAEAVLIANSSGISGGGSKAGLGNIGGLQANSLISLMASGDRGSKDVERALITLRSRTFIINMIKKNNLVPVIFPEAKPEELQSEDMLNQAYEYINKSLKADQERSAYNFSIRHTSPQSAFTILNTVIKSLNEEEKIRVVTKAKQEMAYLNNQLPGVNVLFLREVLYSLIAEKTKESTLAEAQEEYVFSVVDPPILPKKKVAPHRTVIVIVFSVVGLLVGILAATYPAIKTVLSKGPQEYGVENQSLG